MCVYVCVRVQQSYHLNLPRVQLSRFCWRDGELDFPPFFGFHGALWGTRGIHDVLSSSVKSHKYPWNLPMPVSTYICTQTHTRGVLQAAFFSLSPGLFSDLSFCWASQIHRRPLIFLSLISVTSGFLPLTVFGVSVGVLISAGQTERGGAQREDGTLVCFRGGVLTLISI